MYVQLLALVALPAQQAVAAMTLTVTSLQASRLAIV